MLVTTKIGTENTKASINVTVENSFLKPVNEVGYVDGARWMEIYNEAQLARTPNATAEVQSGENRLYPQRHQSVCLSGCGLVRPCL